MAKMANIANVNIAIFGSTNGTSITRLLEEYANNNLIGLQIPFIFSNRKNSGILEKASKYNIKGIHIQYDTDITRNEYDEQLAKLLVDNKVDYVLLVGYMKIITNVLLDKWENKLVNIHPSLLPAFANMMNKSVHKAVLDRGCKITGATLMYVDESVDGGPIIDQRVVQVECDDTVDTLKEKVQSLEGEMLLDFVKNLII